MEQNDLLTDEKQYYKEAFARNIGLISQEEQEKLQQTTVAIAGMGGVGGIFALSLARLGVGSFHISDPDSFNPVNINRQAAAYVSTFGKPKAETVATMIRDINPFAHVSIFPIAETEKEFEPFLEGVNVALDGIDFFTLSARRAMFKQALRMRIPVLTAGPIGFGTCLLHFKPGGIGFDEYFDIHDGMSEEEMALHFGLGITPSGLQGEYMKLGKAVGFKEHTAPSTVTGTLAAANVVTCEVVKLILGRGAVQYVPHTAHFDPYLQRYKKSYYRWGNRSPVQRLKLRILKKKLGIGVQ